MGPSIGNLLATIVIYIFMIIGMTTHQWISAWWFLVIWLACQIFVYAAMHQSPKTDKQLRPWLYHKWPLR